MVEILPPWRRHGAAAGSGRIHNLEGVMKFLHLSDLHFHRSDSKNKPIIKTLKYVRENYPEHYLIITGDTCDDGDNRQMKNALSALEPFKERLYIVPGNHDFGAVGNMYSPDRAKMFDEYLMAGLEQSGRFAGDNDPVVDVLVEGDTKIMLIGLDTNLETVQCFDFACGEVGSRQLASLGSILTSPGRREYVKILYFHHHPFIHKDLLLRLLDADELARVIYGQVDVVMFGHKHVSGIWEGMYGEAVALAADNSPGKDFAREVEVAGTSISVRDVPIRS